MGDNQRVLVIGATGGTGLLVTQLLHAKGVRVRVLVRNPARSAAQFPTEVEVIRGDITKQETLAPAVEGASHIVFMAGVRSGRPATETQIKATEYDGTLNTVAVALRTGFRGRFLYMTSSGVASPSLWSVFLNLYKGNTLVWRRRAEAQIRASGLDYTIIRAGILLSRPGGQRAVVVSQDALPLALRYRIARADVAEVFVAALDHPRASRATFEVIWGHGPSTEDWDVLLGRLKPNSARS